MYYKSINKIKPYLYDIYYDFVDYDYANEYYKSKEDPINIGACSCVRNRNFFGRNLDWLYDNESEFVVHVPKIGNKYSSIGIAGGLKELTEAFVDSGAESELYKVVPFQMYDGINSCGVFTNVNVVPTDKGKNRILPSETSEVELCSTMVIRYILDNYATAKEAVNYIKEHATIYFSKGLHDMDYEVHFLVGDSKDTFIIEFIEGSTVIIENKPYMTNFHLSGVTFNQDGTVYTPATQTETENAFDTNKITENGSGLERFNIIVNSYSSSNSKTGMRELMNKLTYTKAYTNTDNIWYTEFVGEGRTVKTNVATYEAIMPTIRQMYIDRDRDNPDTWQTVHSVVYDVEQKKMYLTVQEDGNELIYRLNKYSGGKNMYKIYIRDDNSVLVSNKHRIMQRSSLVDVVQILVPQMYNDLDMTEFSCMMEYILPCSKEYKVEILEKSDELYDGCIQYFIPMDSELTSEPGDIEVQFTFAKRDNDGTISKTDMIRKTGKSRITIIPISKWSDILVNFDDETGKPYPVDVLDKKLLEINVKSDKFNIDDYPPITI